VAQKLEFWPLLGWFIKSVEGHYLILKGVDKVKKGTVMSEDKSKKKPAPKNLFYEAKGNFRFKLFTGEEFTGLIADQDVFNLLISTEDGGL